MSSHQTNRPTSKERWKFIFFYGMILWGGTTALMVSVVTFFHDKNTEIPEYISHFIIYPLGGVIFASILWPWKPKGSPN